MAKIVKRKTAKASPGIAGAARLAHAMAKSTKLAKLKPVKRKPVKAKAIHRVVAAVPSDGHDATVLDRLFAVVQSRRTADPALSHSARLLVRGNAKIAQKFGEEAVECLIEAVAGNRTALVAESADVLYHLLLMWVGCGVAPGEVWAELERREGVSGLLEKASRPLPRDVATRKIP